MSAIPMSGVFGQDAVAVVKAIVYAAGGTVNIPLQAFDAVTDPRREFIVEMMRDALSGGVLIGVRERGSFPRPPAPRRELELVPKE